MLDLERKGYLETKGNRMGRSKELKVLGLQERPSLESWGSSRGLIYMSYLVIYLASQEMRSKSWKWMSK